LGNDDVAVTCCAYNHNGQLLYAGCADGSVRTVDLRHSEIVDRWTPHTDRLMCLQLSPDHNDCYTLGADNKVIYICHQYPFHFYKAIVFYLLDLSH